MSLITATWLFLATVGVDADLEVKPVIKGQLESTRTCGIASAYAVIRLHGLDVHWDEIANGIGAPDQNGLHSFSGLKNGLLQFGIESISINVAGSTGCLNRCRVSGRKPFQRRPLIVNRAP